MIVTLTQLGYALSLLLVVPLGDIFERRRLIVISTAGSALMLAAVALSPTFQWLLIASFCWATASVAPQLVVPFSAGLVGIERRGRLVGIVMGGLLVGILLSRTLSGLLASAAGWRTVYWTSAGMVFSLSILLRCRLPAQRPENELPRPLWPVTGFSLGCRAQSARIAPSLHHRRLWVWGVQCVSWTTLAFHLANLPGHYGSSMAGMFGLFGVAGALAAPVAGRLADRHDARLVNGTALVLVVAAFVLMGLAGHSLVALAAGVVLMDAGAQASHISNQTRIFGLNAALRNRVNSVYMVNFFIGGACGSAIGSWAWARDGWTGVCWCGSFWRGWHASVVDAGFSPERGKPRFHPMKNPSISEPDFFQFETEYP